MDSGRAGTPRRGDLALTEPPGVVRACPLSEAEQRQGAGVRPERNRDRHGHDPRAAPPPWRRSVNAASVTRHRELRVVGGTRNSRVPRPLRNESCWSQRRTSGGRAARLARGSAHARRWAVQSAARELLSNAARHADASTVQVRLARDGPHKIADPGGRRQVHAGRSPARGHRWLGRRPGTSVRPRSDRRSEPAPRRGRRGRRGLSDTIGRLALGHAARSSSTVDSTGWCMPRSSSAHFP